MKPERIQPPGAATATVEIETPDCRQPASEPIASSPSDAAPRPEPTIEKPAAGELDS